jgi:hypothetical protein
VIALTAVVLGLSLAQTREPVGHVVKVVGKARLIQRMPGTPASATTQTPLTRESNRRRLPLYEGFKVFPIGKSRVVVFAGSELVRYGPPPPGGVPFRVRSPRAQAMGGKRPQGGPRAVNSAREGFLYDPAVGDRLYIHPNGDLIVVWWQLPNVKTLKLRISGLPNSTPREIGLPPADSRKFANRISTYRIKGADSWTRGATSTTKISLELLEPGQKAAKSVWTILPSEDAIAIDSAAQALQRLADPEEDEVELINNLVVRLEEKGCAMEVTSRCLQWWSADLGNYSATAAIHGLAVKAKATDLEAFLQRRLNPATKVK